MANRTDVAGETQTWRQAVRTNTRPDLLVQIHMGLHLHMACLTRLHRNTRNRMMHMKAHDVMHSEQFYFNPLNCAAENQIFLLKLIWEVKWSGSRTFKDTAKWAKTYLIPPLPNTAPVSYRNVLWDAKHFGWSGSDPSKHYVGHFYLQCYRELYCSLCQLWHIFNFNSCVKKYIAIKYIASFSEIKIITLT